MSNFKKVLNILNEKKETTKSKFIQVIKAIPRQYKMDIIPGDTFAIWDEKVIKDPIENKEINSYKITFGWLPTKYFKII